MSEWKKYYDLEPIRRLRNDGRELLGETITLTEKRDGENVSLWLCNGEPQISSHNLEQASEDIVSRFKATEQYKKAVDLLKSESEYNKTYIIYGELLKTSSPTRIEPKRKHIQWVLFDAWNFEEERYVSYTQLYQLAYHYRLPIVRCVDFFIPQNMEELTDKIAEMLKWCKRHRREGIVGKDYKNQVFFKEKIDLSKLPKLPRQAQPQYPPMPEERILRALQHAYDEIGSENWKDVKVAMPIVARHFATEAREHNWSTPRNMYQLYLNTPLEMIVSPKESKQKYE